jgi:hypothetical protein
MPHLMILYLVGFVRAWWPGIHGAQERDMWSVAAEVAALPTTAGKKLRLMNIAAMESGFRRDARGKLGECGAWQVMPPYRSCGADEALRRMDGQGMVAYVGCRRAEDVVEVRGARVTCAQMVANRVDRADTYRMAFDPPDEPAPDPGLLAGR